MSYSPAKNWEPQIPTGHTNSCDCAVARQPSPPRYGTVVFYPSRRVNCGVKGTNGTRQAVIDEGQISNCVGNHLSRLPFVGFLLDFYKIRLHSYTLIVVLFADSSMTLTKGIPFNSNSTKPTSDGEPQFCIDYDSSH